MAFSAIILCFILAISVPIQSQVPPNIVDLGFNQSSFSGIEQGESYKVKVLFFSGEIDSGIILNVRLDLSGTASANDITLSTTVIRFLPTDFREPKDVEFSFTVDNIAQECEETFAITLELAAGTLGQGANFRNRLEGVIIDSDEINFQLSESDYTQNEEPDAKMEILITKGSGIQLAKPVYFRVTLLTVEDALTRGVISEFDPENQFSPDRADYKDFDNTTLIVKFPIDEGLNPVTSVELTIPIVDDEIDEADEQVFIIFLEVINATNIDKVNIVDRKTSIGRIKDDEIIRIGFEFGSYEVTEPDPDDENQISDLVYLIREDNRKSEQTYSVDLTVGDPGGNTKSATIETSDINENFDYSFGLPGQIKINRLFAPTVDRIPFVFSLNPDLAVEGTETFRATSAQVTPSGDFPVFQTPTGVTAFATTLINILDNDELVVGFEELNYTVSESAGTVEVCVVISSPPPTADLDVSVTLSPSTIDGTAEAASDFTELTAFLSTPLVFPSSPGSPTAGPRRQCFDVTITGDDLLENTESFFLLLQEDIFGQQTGATINPNLTEVFILDEDVVNIGFIDDPYEGREESGFAAITVGVTGSVALQREVTVIITSDILSTIPNAATSGTDFLPLNRILTFNSDISITTINVTLLNDNIVEGDEDFLARLEVPSTEMNVVLSKDNATITILDDNIVNIGFIDDPYEGREGGLATVIVGILGGSDLQRNVLINLTTQIISNIPNGAISGVDFIPMNQILTFNSVNTRETINIILLEDSLVEGDEDFLAQLDVLSTEENVALTRDTANVTIIDEDRVVIGFEEPIVEVPENTPNGMILLCAKVLNGTLSRESIIDVVFQDVTAIGDEDYIPSPLSLTFSLDNIRVCFNVSIINDDMDEPEESFLVNITTDDPQVILFPMTTIVNVVDDDFIPAEVQFDPILYDTIEGTNVRLRIVLTEPSRRDVTVDVSTQDGTALAPSDYSSVISQSVTIPAGEVEAFVEVSTINDEINEVFEETFTASLSNATNAMVGENATASIIISDDDIVLVNLDPNNYTVTEGEQVTITAVLSREADRPLSVGFFTDDETATAPDDYEAVNRSIIFPAGETTVMITISTVEDQVAEGNEIFNAFLENPMDGLLLGADSEAMVEILDNDMVSINFDPIMYNVTEGMSATLRLVLSTTSTEVVTVNLTTLDGTATAPEDYTFIMTTIVFPAGSISQEVSVQTVGDTIHERLESFTATLSNPVGGELGSEIIATVFIADDDDLFVNFDPTTYSVTEDESAELSIFLSTQSDHEVTVQFSTVDGSATAPEDYTSTVTNITFPAGSTVQMVSVPTIDDDINEELEEFRAQLSSPSDALMLGSDISAQIDIIDNNSLSVQFVPATYLVQEGEIVQLIAVLNREADRPVSVYFNTFDDTAEAPDDYETVNRTITFTAGETIIMINISTAEDQVVEGNEIFNAFLENPMDGLLLGADSEARVEILDNDMVSINFDPIVYNVTEGMSATLRLVLSTTSTEVVTVQINSVDGSATAPGDYTSNMTTITFPAGTTTQEISFMTVEDSIHERPESFTVILSNPVGGELGSDSTATVNIGDDDDLFVDFDPTIYSVTEGEQIELMVVLNRPSDYDVTVQLNTSDGRATAPGDYTSTTITITFPAGSTNQTVSIPILDDDTNEQLEEFSAQLSNPSEELMLGRDSSAQINIEDNDPLNVQFEPATYSVQEGGRVNLVAVLNREADRNVSVVFNTQDGTAEAPGDYSSISGRILEFPAGVTSVMIPVDTVQDVIAEGDEGFEAILSNPTNGLELGSQDRADITIRDDDVVSVSFGRTLYPVSEGDVALLEVILSTPSTENVSVDIVTMDSSAEAPGDYVRFVTTIEFTAGTTQLELPIPTVEDEVNELGEIFFANLSNPRGGGAMLGRDVDATIEIIDDDPLSISFVPTTYTTDEGEEAMLMIALNREADRPISVDVSTSENTAKDPDDYNGVSTTVTFSPGETLVDFPISIVDDIISEPSEEDFEATLSNPSPGAILGNSTAQISIVDNDVIRIRFEQPTYEFVEENIVRMICLIKEGISLEPISITNITIVDGTATEGMDYIGIRYNLTFETDTNVKVCIEIEIIADNEQEPPETLRVILNLPLPDAPHIVPGSPPEAIITIRDSGVLVNDTIIGDPLFTVPISVSSEQLRALDVDDIQLCYEIHGAADQWFNLVTDECTSVNAQYTSLTPSLNVISIVGVRAVDVNGSCKSILVNIDQCSVSVDGTNLAVGEKYSQGDVNVKRYSNRARISVPNCADLTLVMWVICQQRTLQSPDDPDTNITANMIKFVVKRGLNFGHRRAHGLLGQFWNIPVDVTPFTGLLRNGEVSSNRYIVNITGGSKPRTYTGYLYELSWDHVEEPCLYVGNRQAGPIHEIATPELNDGVIENIYDDYRVNNAFSEENYVFGLFDEDRCSAGSGSLSPVVTSA